MSILALKGLFILDVGQTVNKQRRRVQEFDLGPSSA